MNLTELNELMYVPATVIAGEVKEKTTQKNAKRELAWNLRISETIECYSKDLAIQMN